MQQMAKRKSYQYFLFNIRFLCIFLCLGSVDFKDLGCFLYDIPLMVQIAEGASQENESCVMKRLPIKI